MNGFEEEGDQIFEEKKKLSSIRNVTIYNFNTAIIGGIWQYGGVTFQVLYKWLEYLIVAFSDHRAIKNWGIYRYDHGTLHADEFCPRNEHLVEAGDYVIAAPERIEQFEVGLVPAQARARVPTPSNNPAREHYRNRALARDGRCLITGMRTASFSILKATHIFPRGHDREWTRMKFAQLIADPAPTSEVGETKIDSIQNIITLRTDLRDAWYWYEFGVDVEDDYKIVPFVPGLEEIVGKRLNLDRIRDPNARPLDALLKDHFLQGLHKHVKGDGETKDSDEEHDLYDDLRHDVDLSDEQWKTPSGKEMFHELYDDLRYDDVDLSDEKWRTPSGKEMFELTLQDRLHTHYALQELGDSE